MRAKFSGSVLQNNYLKNIRKFHQKASVLGFLNFQNIFIRTGWLLLKNQFKYCTFRNLSLNTGPTQINLPTPSVTSGSSPPILEFIMNSQIYHRTPCPFFCLIIRGFNKKQRKGVREGRWNLFKCPKGRRTFKSLIIIKFSWVYSTPKWKMTSLSSASLPESVYPWTLFWKKTFIRSQQVFPIATDWAEIGRCTVWYYITFTNKN